MRFTDRLRLEAIGPEHVDDLLALHADPSVAEWHGGPWTEEVARRRAIQWREAWGREGVHKWIAYHRIDGTVVGRGGLSRAVVDGVDSLELGWTVRSELWGQGYATEMGRAGLSLAFDELDADEVIAFTEPHNRRSRAVMERLQMTYVKDIEHEGEHFVLYVLPRP